jgi:hypothetical protein
MHLTVCVMIGSRDLCCESNMNNSLAIQLDHGSLLGRLCNARLVRGLRKLEKKLMLMGVEYVCVARLLLVIVWYKYCCACGLEILAYGVLICLQG